MDVGGMVVVGAVAVVVGAATVVVGAAMVVVTAAVLGGDVVVVGVFVPSSSPLSASATMTPTNTIASTTSAARSQRVRDDVPRSSWSPPPPLSRVAPPVLLPPAATGGSPFDGGPLKSSAAPQLRHTVAPASTGDPHTSQYR